MMFIKFAAVLVLSSSLVTADARNAVDDGTGVSAAVESNVSPARPTFLRDGEEWGSNPFKCRRTQDMCDSCSRDCGCKTGNCSWNFVCYGQNRKGNNGCLCKLDSDCVSGRCSKYLKCENKVPNGGGCMEDDDCVSRRCSKGFKCYDQLENGEGCMEDDDCKSGRCATKAWKLGECAAKLKNGESCMADDDCEGRNCAGWWVTAGITGTCREGGCTETIPFMATNAKIQYDGQETFFNYHSDDFENEFNFFKEVSYCPNAGNLGAYRIYGTLVSADDFRAEVEAHINSTSNNYDSVLYNIHGVNVDPESSFKGVYNFMRGNGANTNILAIPISWRNRWGATIASYEYDRNNSAPRAGRQLAAKFSVFSSSVPTSIMCHSMGNYVFRVFAQNVGSPALVFNNLYMVAADARMDMFGTDFNPGAPRNAVATAVAAPAAQNYVDIPDSELQENGGYDITKIASHVHVVWNLGDHALLVRETFQFGFGGHVRKAIGKYGDQAEELMTLPYFQERVTFHDFSAVIEEIGIEHNYQWYDQVVALYAEFKAEKMMDFKME